MKVTLLKVLILLSINYYSQLSLVDSSKVLTKICFIDDQNINYDGGYGLKYEMEQNKGGDWQLVQTNEYEYSRGGYASDLKKNYKNTKRKIISSVPNYLIDKLVNAVDTRMTKMNEESLWFTDEYLNANATKIAEKSYQWKNLNQEEREYFEGQIKKKRLVEFILETYYIGHMTTDYPTFGVQFIYGQDTIHVHSHEQEALMLPWVIWTPKDSLKTFNPQIPLTISQILPEHKRSNVNRLKKESMEKLIASRIYWDFCRDHFAEEKSKNKFQSTLLELSKNLEVISSKEQNMSSLDWEGNNSVLRCEVRDSTIRQHIFYDLKLEIINGVPYSPDSILNKAAAINLRLKEFPFLFELLDQKSIESIKVHFTNNQSFSSKARKGFIRDAGNHFYEQHKSNMTNAVLLTISHEGGYGRYLILDSGDLMLWHYFGKVPPFGYNQLQLKTQSGLFKNSFVIFNSKGEILNKD